MNEQDTPAVDTVLDNWLDYAIFDEDDEPRARFKKAKQEILRAVREEVLASLPKVKERYFADEIAEDAYKLGGMEMRNACRTAITTILGGGETDGDSK